MITSRNCNCSFIWPFGLTHKCTVTDFHLFAMLAGISNIWHMQTHWACPKGRTLVDNCFVKTSYICCCMEIWRRKITVGLQLNVCQERINTLGKYPLEPSRSTGNALPCQMDPQESASQRFPSCCLCYTWAKNHSTIPCKQRVYKLKAASAKDQDNQQCTTWARLLHPPPRSCFCTLSY